MHDQTVTVTQHMVEVFCDPILLWGPRGSSLVDNSIFMQIGGMGIAQEFTAMIRMKYFNFVTSLEFNLGTKIFKSLKLVRFRL